MAVSPYDLEQKFEYEVDLLEIEIDEQLNKKAIHKGGSITTSVSSNIPVNHFNTLKTRYLSVGWSSVELISDPKDGPYLKFTY